MKSCPTASPTASSSSCAEDVALSSGFGKHLHAQLVEQAGYSQIYLGIFSKGLHFLQWVRGLESSGHSHRGMGEVWPPPEPEPPHLLVMSEEPMGRWTRAAVQTSALCPPSGVMRCIPGPGTLLITQLAEAGGRGQRCAL